MAALRRPLRRPSPLTQRQPDDASPLSAGGAVPAPGFSPTTPEIRAWGAHAGPAGPGGGGTAPAPSASASPLSPRAGAATTTSTSAPASSTSALPGAARRPFARAGIPLGQRSATQTASPAPARPAAPRQPPATPATPDERFASQAVLTPSPSKHTVPGPVLAEELQELAELHKAGELSGKEYENAKRLVIGVKGKEAAAPGSSTLGAAGRAGSSRSAAAPLRAPSLAERSASPAASHYSVAAASSSHAQQRESNAEIALLKKQVTDLQYHLTRKVNMAKISSELHEERHTNEGLREQLARLQRMNDELAGADRYGGASADGSWRRETRSVSPSPQAPQTPGLGLASVDKTHHRRRLEEEKEKEDRDIGEIEVKLYELRLAKLAAEDREETLKLNNDELNQKIETLQGTLGDLKEAQVTQLREQTEQARALEAAKLRQVELQEQSVLQQQIHTDQLRALSPPKRESSRGRSSSRRRDSRRRRRRDSSSSSVSSSDLSSSVSSSSSSSSRHRRQKKRQRKEKKSKKKATEKKKKKKKAKKEKKERKEKREEEKDDEAVTLSDSAASSSSSSPSSASSAKGARQGGVRARIAQLEVEEQKQQPIDDVSPTSSPLAAAFAKTGGGGRITPTNKAKSEARADDAAPAEPDGKRRAEKLHAAMAGLGTDEALVMSTLGELRAQEELEEVKRWFKKLFPAFEGGLLVPALRSELSNKELEECEALLSRRHISLFGVVTPQQQARARAAKLHEAMAGPGTDEAAVFAVCEAIENRGEWASLEAAFMEGYPRFHKGDLQKAMVSELTGAEMQRCAAVLKPKNIYLSADSGSEDGSDGGGDDDDVDDKGGGGTGGGGRGGGGGGGMPSLSSESKDESPKPAGAHPSKVGRIGGASESQYSAAGSASSSRPPEGVRRRVALGLQDRQDDDTASRYDSSSEEGGASASRRSASRGDGAFSTCSKRSARSSSRGGGGDQKTVAEQRAAALHDAVTNSNLMDDDVACEVAQAVQTQGEWESVRQAYARQYGDDLVSALEGSLSDGEMRRTEQALRKNGVLLRGGIIGGGGVSSASRASGGPASESAAAAAVRRADVLYESVSGLGTDEEAIAGVLREVEHQRAWNMVRDTFEERYPTRCGGDVVRALEDDLSSREMKACARILSAKHISLRDSSVPADLCVSNSPSAEDRTLPVSPERRGRRRPQAAARSSSSSSAAPLAASPIRPLRSRRRSSGGGAGEQPPPTWAEPEDGDGGERGPRQASPSPAVRRGSVASAAAARHSQNKPRTTFSDAAPAEAPAPQAPPRLPSHPRTRATAPASRSPERRGRAAAESVSSPPSTAASTDAARASNTRSRSDAAAVRRDRRRHRKENADGQDPSAWGSGFVFVGGEADAGRRDARNVVYDDDDDDSEDDDEESVSAATSPLPPPPQRRSASVGRGPLSSLEQENHTLRSELGDLHRDRMLLRQEVQDFRSRLGTQSYRDLHARYQRTARGSAVLLQAMNKHRHANVRYHCLYRFLFERRTERLGAPLSRGGGGGGGGDEVAALHRQLGTSESIRRYLEEQVQELESQMRERDRRSADGVGGEGSARRTQRLEERCRQLEEEVLHLERSGAAAAAAAAASAQRSSESGGGSERRAAALEAELAAAHDDAQHMRATWRRESEEHARALAAAEARGAAAASSSRAAAAAAAEDEELATQARLHEAEVRGRRRAEAAAAEAAEDDRARAEEEAAMLRDELRRAQAECERLERRGLATERRLQGAERELHAKESAGPPPGESEGEVPYEQLRRNLMHSERKRYELERHLQMQSGGGSGGGGGIGTSTSSTSGARGGPIASPASTPTTSAPPTRQREDGDDENHDVAWI